MSNSARPLHRSILVAGLAVLVAGLAHAGVAGFDARLHDAHARVFAGPSRSHGVVLVAVDEATRAAWGDPPWAPALTEELAAELGRGAPRLIIWPAGQVEAAGAEGPEGPALGLDPISGPTLLRADEPDFPAAALAALGAPARATPLPVRYATQVPTVPAQRVLAGGIPASTFRDKVVVIGRTDAEVRTVATPLGAMSPAQVEAQALLGVLDGARWLAPPLWLRLAALGLWALGVALLLSERRPAALLGLMALACVGALVLDAALFAAGLMRIGAGAPVLATLVAGAAHLCSRAARRPVAALPRPRMRVRLTTTAVDFHKVSET